MKSKFLFSAVCASLFIAATIFFACDRKDETLTTSTKPVKSPHPSNSSMADPYTQVDNTDGLFQSLLANGDFQSYLSAQSLSTPTVAFTQPMFEDYSMVTTLTKNATTTLHWYSAIVDPEGNIVYAAVHIFSGERGQSSETFNGDIYMKSPDLASTFYHVTFTNGAISNKEFPVDLTSNNQFRYYKNYSDCVNAQEELFKGDFIGYMLLTTNPLINLQIGLYCYWDQHYNRNGRFPL